MSSDARDFFRSSVAEYNQDHYASRSLMSVRLACMLSHLGTLELPSDARVLDAGCGPGRLLEAVRSQGWSGVGIDTSLGMLSLAAERLGDKPPALAAASVETLPFSSESFDAVCTAGVFEYLKEDATGLRELIRVLRPGGALLFPITNLWSPIGYLDFAVEALKRRPWILEPFNRLWTARGRNPIRARHFHVRRQRPGATRALLERLGVDVVAESYFYFLPFPHPFDRLFPKAALRLGERMESLASSPIAPIAEGWLAVGRKSMGLPARSKG